MSVGALVAQIGEVLGRAHALFGDPPSSGASAATGASRKLAGAAEFVSSGGLSISALSGRFATGYGAFAGVAGPALDAFADADDRLSEPLQGAADADSGGRAASGSVIDGAAGDTAGLAAFSNTPAGQKALLAALRARVAQQQRVVAAYRDRDAQLAAMLQSMSYAGRGVVGAGAPTTGGGGGVGLGMPQLGGVAGLAGLFGRPGGRRVARASVPNAVRDIPAGPGGVVVRAGLTRLGAPYVWGAEGPSSFDCSGYTEWAWRHAGVQLGDDTYAQVKQGIAVPPGQVRAGDLIFPKDSFTAAGPGHVMLAISPTQVAHAPQSGDVVRIAAMPLSYVARRPLPPG